MNTASAPTPATPVILPLIVQHDDGKFSIGLADDAAGPFESRRFAEAVALTLTAVSS
jgi:hypothetical protein